MITIGVKIFCFQDLKIHELFLSAMTRYNFWAFSLFGGEIAVEAELFLFAAVVILG